MKKLEKLSLKTRICLLLVAVSLIVIFFYGAIHILKNTSYTSKNIYVVQYESSGGTIVGNEQVKDGNKIIVPENPSKNGFTFIGWYLGDKKYDFDSKIDSDIILTAKWEKEEGTELAIISFNSNGGNNVSDIEVAKGDIVRPPLDPKRTNYIFQGWYHNNKFFNFSLTITQNIELVAKWGEIKIPTQVNSNSNADIQSPTNNNKNKEQLIFAYDAFVNYKCSYEKFSFDINTKTCFDTEDIKATSKLECEQGYIENNGMCEKNIILNAVANKICINGGVMRNGECWRPYDATDRAIGVCPNGYTYYYGGFGYEKGYCKENDTNNKIEANYTCDGIKSLDNPVLNINSTEAYCKGTQYTFTGINNETLVGVEYSCQEGYTLNGNKCTKLDVKSKINKYYCPSGYVEFFSPNLASYNCEPDKKIRKDILIEEFYCPGEGVNGRVMIDNKCYDKIIIFN